MSAAQEAVVLDIEPCIVVIILRCMVLIEHVHYEGAGEINSMMIRPCPSAFPHKEKFDHNLIVIVILMIAVTRLGPILLRSIR